MFHIPEDSAQTASLILNGLPMGLLFCDREGIVRFVNHAYASLLEKNTQEILGKDILEIIPHSRAHEVMEQGKSEMGELCLLGGEQSRPVIVNRLPVRDASGEVAGMISQALFKDPEDLKRLSSKIEMLGRKLNQYKKRFAASVAAQHTFSSILGECESMLLLKRQAQSYARLDEPVLILGPTGAGKELFAHAIHAASIRSEGPLVCINCATIPRDLFESEIFGYEKGAFSGAAKDGKIGQIELADKGTLFLDEIGEMPPEIQAKLLRVLETGTICRLGSVHNRHIDFRLIAATNRNISAMLRNGAFREDLYYRINTFILDIPPLSERENDALLIARYILGRMGLDHVKFSEAVQSALVRFSWPGNVRQLHNAVVHAAATRQKDIIGIEDFPPETLPEISLQIEKDLRQDELTGWRISAERAAILQKLRQNKGNVAACARELKIARTTLYTKMKRYGIDPRN